MLYLLKRNLLVPRSSCKVAAFSNAYNFSMFTIKPASGVSLLETKTCSPNPSRATNLNTNGNRILLIAMAMTVPRI